MDQSSVEETKEVAIEGDQSLHLNLMQINQKEKKNVIVEDVASSVEQVQDERIKNEKIKIA